MRRTVSFLLAIFLAIPVGIGTPTSSFAVGSSSSSEFTITLADLSYILKQIQISEAHATREASNGSPITATSVLGLGVNDVPNATFPWGLRQVDGRNNNLGTGTDARSGRLYSNFGAADQPFPRLVSPNWINLQGAESYDPANTTRSACGPAQCITDAGPRWISNLIVDQSRYTPKDGTNASKGNPAAVIAAGNNIGDTGSAGMGEQSLVIANTPPAGAPAGVRYTSMFTFFGQFFDHGLDLVSKLATQAVRLPLPAGDVLNVDPANPSSMYLNRTAAPNDQTNAGMNRTTPWIDQNQTYTSHPSKQMFIREYQTIGGTPKATGRLLTGSKGEIGTWAQVKSEALLKLNIRLTDTDVFNVPLFLTDEYGRFLRGTNGFPQLVQRLDGSTTIRYRSCTSGSPCTTAPESARGQTWRAVATGHAFLDDIAHAADPSFPTTYSPELLGVHFVTGDGRGNENIGLTAIHTVFHSEHNRLYGDIKSKIDALGSGSLYSGFTSATGWGYGERLFQAAKFVAEMEYQHLVFDTFVRRIEPGIHAFAGYNPTTYPDVTAEFASAVYRFGHSMLNETVLRTKADGTKDNRSLFDSFLNPVSFMSGYNTADEAAGSVARGSIFQAGNEIDEFVTGALRNNLVGIPLDLAALNLARGRDVGLPSLNATRAALLATTKDPSLSPYTSWSDFGRRMRYRGGAAFGASLVNFIAAYGVHTSLASATTVDEKRDAATALLSDASFMDGSAATTGLNDVDLWIGGLAETRGIAAGMLGSTFTYVFRKQMEDLQDGDRFYYLHRLAGTNLLNQVASNTLADMFIRNTDVRELPADMFSLVDNVIPASQGTYTGEKNIVFVGTEFNDNMRADNGNDTLRGFGGNDLIDGDEGSDTIHGGSGNDVLMDTGLTGADIVLGGSGDDYISSGPGLDVNDGQAGNDVIVLGPNGPLVTGGQGNDLIFGGAGVDTITGDEGDDWIEGSGGADSINGDLVLPPLGIDLVLFGNDVVIGGTGSDILTGAGGDDILGAGDDGLATTPDTLLGGNGFDWATYTFGNKAVNVDLTLVARTPGVLEQVSMDLFPDGDVEGLSGGPGNDILLGDDRITLVGATFSDALTATGSSLISGLSSILFTGIAGVGDGTRGNILLGGPGSDRIQGRLGNDLIDGDAYLEVWLEHNCTGGMWTRATSAQIAELVRLGTISNACTGSNVRIARSLNPGVKGVTGEVDIAVFLGRIRDYSITCVSVPAVPCTVYRVVGPDGDDIVMNIESLRFNDGDLRLDGTVPATVAPSVPRNVVVLSANTSLTVQWTAPATGDGTITYTARAWFGNQTRPTSTCQTTTLSCPIPSLTNGTTYSVDVIASNSLGTSAPSPRVQGVAGTPTVSGAPTGVVATAAPLSAGISWVAPLNTGGSVITGYTARAWTTSTGGTTPIASCGSTATLSCVITGLSSGTVYFVDVIAINGVGSSLPSPRVSVTPTADPGPSAPQSVTASPINGGARVSWLAPLNLGAPGAIITGYTATAYSASSGGAAVNICTTNGIALTCDITGLTGSTQYWVAVKAINSNNITGVESVRVTVTPTTSTLTVPSAPLNVQATSPSARTITTTWNAPTSNGGSAITGYTVRIWQKASGGKQITSCSWGSGPLTCSNTGIAPGTYYVDVVAVNAQGTGQVSTPRVSVIVI